MVENKYSYRIFEIVLVIILACVGVFGGIFSRTENSAAQGENAITTVNVVITDSSTPLINGITPDQGPIEGGTRIRIRGKNLGNVVDVTVGGNTCTNLAVIDSDTIECDTPPGTAGLADVTVTTVEGWTNTKQNGFTYYEESKPIPPIPPILPLPPATGLFTLGNLGKITNYDIIFIIAGSLVIGGVIFLMVCGNSKDNKKISKTKKPAKSSSKRKKTRK